MGLFGIRKKEEVVDWSEKYKKQQKKTAEANATNQSSGTSSLGFLGSLASSSNSSESSDSGYINMSEADDKKKKLSKMLMDLTKRIEDLSNQIYHVRQRVELLEKKLKISFE